MTLVVARITGSRIAIASDTLVMNHGSRLPVSHGIIKSCLLPGGICISFANSPELALRDCWTFYIAHPDGADFKAAVEFFQTSSKKTNNDYLLAFAKNPQIVKIADGRLQTGDSKTLWIGDKSAFEAFREVESTTKRYESGRAVNAVLFADEETNSPASDLYAIMRHMALDPKVPFVGGFVCVVSNRQDQFRHSVYSDMLFNPPFDAGADYFFEDLKAKLNFGASGENEEFSTSQFSTSYGDFNCVGFYLLRARVAYLFHPGQTLLATHCTVLKNVDPVNLESHLWHTIKNDLGWLIFISAASPTSTNTVPREPSAGNEDNGVQFTLKVHVNTFPPSGQYRVLPELVWKPPTKP